MTTEIKLPELGENIETAEVLSVLVASGDRVAKDQPLIELETDKATAEVPSEVAGVVKDVKVKEGEEIKVGQVIVVIEPEDGDGAEPEETGDAEGEPEEADEAEAEEAGEEETGEEETEETGAAEEEAATEEEPPKKKRGPERKRAAEKDDEEEDARARAGKEAGTEKEKKEKEKEKEKKEEEEKEEEKEEEASDDSGDTPAGRTKEEDAGGENSALGGLDSSAPIVGSIGEVAPAAPSVRRLARELGLDINRVPGSGPGGRISEGDVKDYARELISRSGPAAAPAPPAETGPAVPELPDFSPWGETEREPANKVRRVTAEAMSLSWNQIPHVTQFDRSDITELEAWRKRYGDKVERAGGKLTVTAIVVKAVAGALKMFPRFNASYDARNEEIVYKKYIHIGVAVDTDRGLLVPVIRDADEKNIAAIAVELGDLAERARSRKIKAEELQGGNINVSNLGGLGTTYFSPIIAWPQVAVVGVGRANREAVYEDEGFVPRLILPLAVSYDHRVIDGADAARFLRWIAEALEQPLLIALEG